MRITNEITRFAVSLVYAVPFAFAMAASSSNDLVTRLWVFHMSLLVVLGFFVFCTSPRLRSMGRIVCLSAVVALFAAYITFVYLPFNPKYVVPEFIGGVADFSFVYLLYLLIFALTGYALFMRGAEGESTHLP